MQLGARRSRRHEVRPGGDADQAALAAELITDLRRLIVVHHLPLHDAVARLDTSSVGWVLYLDSDSPAEDQYWAVRDVIRVMVLGVDAAVSAVRSAPLRLVPDQRTGHDARPFPTQRGSARD